MSIHEMYGQLAEKLDREVAEHLRTVDVLRQLKSGSITLDRLTVTDSGWAVAADQAAEVKQA